MNESSDESTPLGPNTRDVLVVLAGLPGTGKTTIGRLLSDRLRAAYLRTDVIAGPMLLEGLTEDDAEAGRVAYGIAREVATENLRAGVPVVVDGVHATHDRRALWRGVAEATRTRLVQLEITLADTVVHRRRVERRQARGYVGPTWEQIRTMHYDGWNEAKDGSRLLVDGFDTEAALACCLTQVLRPGMPEPTRVYVDMVGDLFHPGHVALLRAARGFGDQLVVGVLSDETVAAYKRRPIMTMDERVAVIEACRYVDEVIPDSPYRVTQEFLDEHDLALVVHGDDAGAGGLEDVYGPVLEAGLLRLVPRMGDISTTALIGRVRGPVDR